MDIFNAKLNFASEQKLLSEKSIVNCYSNRLQFLMSLFKIESKIASRFFGVNFLKQRQRKSDNLLIIYPVKKWIDIFCI